MTLSATPTSSLYGSTCERVDLERNLRSLLLRVAWFG